METNQSFESIMVPIIPVRLEIESSNFMFNCEIHWLSKDKLLKRFYTTRIWSIKQKSY